MAFILKPVEMWISSLKFCLKEMWLLRTPCALGAFGTTTRASCLQIMSENIWLPGGELREYKGTGEIAYCGVLLA